jgi:peptidoglycan/LPS O-acetylase OafA/YrhL
MAAVKLDEAPPNPLALRHNTALDGIRGLAILMVLIRHLVTINSDVQTPFYAVARNIQGSLASGVDVFFALSGFLITRILVQTASDKHFFRNFYARRALRIFPLYYGVLLVVFALTPVFHIHWGGDQWRLLTYSNHLVPSRSGDPWNFYYGGSVNLVNFWSLHIEEQFYMLWPVFVFFLRSPRRLLRVAASVSLVCLVLRVVLYHRGYSSEFIYTALITRADSLLIGACLALGLRTSLHARLLKWATPGFIGSLLLVIADNFAQHFVPWSAAILSNLIYTLVSICATALIAMCLKPASKTAFVFRSGGLVFFGRYSYGLYIFHSVLPMLYMRWLPPLTQSIGRPALGHLLETIAELAMALGASMLSYHFFEKPLLRLKRFFPADRHHAEGPVSYSPSAQPVSAVS